MAVIGTFALPVLVHEPNVTVTDSATLPLEPAVKVMLAPLPALVSVPLVMLHAYVAPGCDATLDRKSTRLNSSHSQISYAVFCLKKKKKKKKEQITQTRNDASTTT